MLSKIIGKFYLPFIASNWLCKVAARTCSFIDRSIDCVASHLCYAFSLDASPLHLGGAKQKNGLATRHCRWTINKLA